MLWFARKKGFWVGLGLLGLGLFLSGCASGARREIPRGGIVTPGAGQAGSSVLNRRLDLVKGRDIYKAACMACHGVFGNGQGPSAKWLSPKPRDFTKGLYKWRTTPFGALPTDEDLERVIREGVSGTDMFPFREVLDRQSRRAVAHYIKTFSPRFADPAQRPSPQAVVQIPLQRPFPASKESVANGRALFQAKGCAVCHGQEGDGDGPAAGGLVDSAGDPIRPWNFRHAFFKSGPNDRDLFRTISTGLNGTPMPGYMALTTEQERWQLVDFIRSLGNAHVSFLHYLFIDEPGGQVYDPSHSSRR